MIEGGGLGQYHPKDIGPAKNPSERGVIDLLVDNEEKAVAIAKKYLSYLRRTLHLESA